MPPRRPRGEGAVSRNHGKEYGCPPSIIGADGKRHRPEHVCNALWVGRLELTKPGEVIRRRKAIYGHSRKEVLRELGKLRREFEANGDIATDRLTVEAWMNLWLTDIAPLRVQPTTLPGYKSKVRLYIIPAIGKHRLDKLRPEHLRAMYRGMADRDPPLARNTIRQTHSILARALKVAVREGKVARNVTDLIDAPTPEEKDPVSLPRGDIEKLLAAIEGTPNESRWLAAFALGLRQGEVLGMTWDHVNFELGTMKVAQALARLDGKLVMKTPKSKKSTRIIPIARNEVILDALRARHAAYLEEREAMGYDDHRLVWGQASGRPRDARRDYQEWVDLCKHVGVAEVRLHDARHSAATTLMLLGTSLPVIAAILGHANITTTMRYIHADLTSMQDAIGGVARRAIES